MAENTEVILALTMRKFMIFSKYFRSASKGVVRFLPGGEKLPIHAEETLLELALNHKLDVDHSCEGMGTCGTCRVFLESENNQNRTELESSMAQDRGFAANERLACQLKPEKGMIVRICSSDADSP